MAKPDSPPGQADKDAQDRARGTAGAPGQDKVYQVTNPTSGETRSVTQRQWREEKLGQKGFVKPPDLPDTDTPDQTAPQ